MSLLRTQTTNGMQLNHLIPGIPDTRHKTEQDSHWWPTIVLLTDVRCNGLLIPRPLGCDCLVISICHLKPLTSPTIMLQCCSNKYCHTPLRSCNTYLIPNVHVQSKACISLFLIIQLTDLINTNTVGVVWGKTASTCRGQILCCQTQAHF